MPRAVVAGAVALVAAGVGLVTAGTGPGAARCVPAAALGTARTVRTDRGPAASPDARAVAALLDRLDGAVRAGRPPDGLPLSGSAATLVRRLRVVPVSGWTTQVREVEPGDLREPGPAASGTDPSGADGPAPGADEAVPAAEEAVPGAPVRRVSVRARVRYRLPDDARDTVRDRLVVAEESAGCWRLVADDPDEAGAGTPDLWDLDPVRVTRTARTLVIAPASLGAERTAAVARVVDEASAVVDTVWGTDWRRTSVVLAPATLAQAGRIARTNAEGWQQLAAFTLLPATVDGASAFGDVRVLVLPAAMDGLTSDGLFFVLAHELTHEATAAASRAEVPIWLSECFADTVGWRALRLPPDRVDRIVGDDLRGAGLTTATVLSGGLPPSLPTVADFDPFLRNVQGAYALSDAACLALADGPRTDVLARVYRVAAGSAPADGFALPPAVVALAAAAGASGRAGASGADRTPSGDLLARGLATAGTDEDRLVAAWHRRVADLVAR